MNTKTFYAQKLFSLSFKANIKAADTKKALICQDQFLRIIAITPDSSLSVSSGLWYCGGMGFMKLANDDKLSERSFMIRLNIQAIADHQHNS